MANQKPLSPYTNLQAGRTPELVRSATPAQTGKNVQNGPRLYKPNEAHSRRDEVETGQVLAGAVPRGASQEEPGGRVGPERPTDPLILRLLEQQKHHTSLYQELLQQQREIKIQQERLRTAVQANSTDQFVGQPGQTLDTLEQKLRTLLACIQQAPHNSFEFGLAQSLVAELALLRKGYTGFQTALPTAPSPLRDEFVQPVVQGSPDKPQLQKVYRRIENGCEVEYREYIWRPAGDLSSHIEYMPSPQGTQTAYYPSTAYYAATPTVETQHVPNFAEQANPLIANDFLGAWTSQPTEHWPSLNTQATAFPPTEARSFRETEIL
eukprot:TRINITY_DN2822_c0_g1_i1.p1 TRINITY_DN2822_c0_g1~~TRINITY_DN2822_c0_g1_i1.p1  ORF type:complete len:323 (-),score=39.23 TRINITY_DN2822_c0_g1_i1:72-1040(-)